MTDSSCGAEVRRYDAETGDPLPFNDGSVDLVMSRHERIDEVQVARVEDLPIQVSRRRFRINAAKLRPTRIPGTFRAAGSTSNYTDLWST